MNISPATPLLQVDSSNEASINNMVSKTNIVISTVGPYQLYGNDLIKSCISQVQIMLICVVSPLG